MNGSAKPLLLGLLLLVAGAVAAVYFVTTPSSRPPTAEVASPEGSPSEKGTAVGEGPAPPPAVPERSPERGPRVVAPTGEGRGGYANAIAGEVRSETGAPVEGATVTAEQGAPHPFAAFFAAPGPTNLFRAASGKDGRFRIAGIPPDDRYLVRASHPSFAPAELNNISVPAEGETPIALILRSGYALEGNVFDASHQPLAGVDLTLDSAIGSPFATDAMKDRRTTKSDPAGHYRFENLPSGQRTLSAFAPGYGMRTAPNLQFMGETKTVTHDLYLTEGKEIVGRVTDEAGQGIAAAKVEATGYATQDISRGEASSGPDGSFSIPGLAAGTYAVVASAPGYSRETQPRAEAGGEPVTIVLAVLGTIEGRVLDRASGRGIPSFRLEARKVSATGAAAGTAVYGRTGVESRYDNAKDGAFVFSGLDPGRYALLASANGYAQGYSAEFEVARGGRTTNVDIALGKGGSLSGRLLDPKGGRPVAGATITTRDNTFQDNPFVEFFRPFLVTNLSPATVRSGEDGTWRIDHLMAGTYQIEVEHARYTKRYLKDLVVDEGRATDVPEIQMFAGASVRGAAVDGAGQPIKGGQVTLRPTSGQSPTQRQIRTDANGRFSLRNLPPGEYEISVSSVTDANPNPFQVILDMQKSKKSIALNEGDDLEVSLILPG